MKSPCRQLVALVMREVIMAAVKVMVGPAGQEGSGPTWGSLRQRATFRHRIPQEAELECGDGRGVSSSAKVAGGREGI